jgi:hypothetical protein
MQSTRFLPLSFAVALVAIAGTAADQTASPGSPAPQWRFVVGGDSRNCGDIVMPVIAAAADRDQAAFYWHLGDFRAIYDFDQDLLAEPEHRGRHLNINDYLRGAWDDFLQEQLGPFHVPVFLAIGNHELVAPKSRGDYVAQFADWIDSPVIQRQRLADDARDHKVKTYYHWIQNGIDFITLDNASSDQFDGAQVKWFESVLGRAKSSPDVRAIVVGLHEALPDSLSFGHGMNDWAQGEQSGRRVYQDLLKARDESRKPVYVLASHSHFYMDAVYNTEYWRTHGGVLPGWIIGTTGAVRYKLPPEASQAHEARTNVYGYLLATVNPPGQPGTVAFEFRELKEGDVPAAVVTRFTPEAVHECFAGNSETLSK